MKKRILLCIILFCLTLSGCQLPEIELPDIKLSDIKLSDIELSDLNLQYLNPANLLFSLLENKAEAERLPSVPKDLRDHILLDERDTGFCETLTGNVLITVIFVNDPSSSWTKEESDAVMDTHIGIIDALTQQAEFYNANLQLEFLYKEVSIDLELDVSNEIPWVSEALSKAGLNSVYEANLLLEQYRHKEEAPILLYRNTEGRSFATTDPSGTIGEYAVMYNNDDDGGTFLHELYHLFGAVDYYYPSEIELLTKIYFPDSIMYDSSAENKVDSLTAYLIGWTDVLSEDALKFLRRSSHITAEYLNSENEKETYTGTIENFRLSDGVYTGDLLMGEQHGWGKMIWDDGDEYEGDWEYGIGHGEGTYSWDGNVYTGSLVYGYFHGTGTLTWATGETYTGTWENDEMHGEGTFVWADGTIYVGEYQHNWENGYGVMTWNDGTVYEGEFKDGYLHGKGTMTYPDGTKVSGEWNRGTYVSP